MTVLCPKLCYNEMCYKETALYQYQYLDLNVTRDPLRLCDRPSDNSA